MCMIRQYQAGGLEPSKRSDDEKQDSRRAI
jgi:hypothetical protein